MQQLLNALVLLELLLNCYARQQLHWSGMSWGLVKHLQALALVMPSCACMAAGAHLVCIAQVWATACPSLDTALIDW